MSQEIDEFDFLEQENSSFSTDKKSQDRNPKEPKTFTENVRQISPNKKIFLLWLILVIVWNFGVPGALPIYDILVALGLSALSTFLINRT